MVQFSLGSFPHNSCMAELKPIVSVEHFEELDIRVGRVLEVELAEAAPKRSYKLKVDFGKYGIKTSVARLTQHAADELKDKLVLGVLNFAPREIGGSVSEFLTLGVQFPKADSGEATVVTPLNQDAKIGSKLF